MTTLYSIESITSSFASFLGKHFSHSVCKLEISVNNARDGVLFLNFIYDAIFYPYRMSDVYQDLKMSKKTFSY